MSVTTRQINNDKLESNHVAYVNRVMSKVNEQTDILYESLMDYEDLKEVSSTCNKIIVLMNKIITSNC